MTDQKNIDKLLSIGVIVSSHGIKGECKVKNLSANPANFKYYKIFYDNCGNVLNIIHVRVTNKFVICKFEGVENRNQSDLMIGQKIFIKKSQLPKVNKDEFYFEDLKGLMVIDSKDREVGIINNVEDFGAGTIIEIKFNNQTTELVPFHTQYFPEINMEQKFVRFIPPKYSD